MLGLGVVLHHEDELRARSEHGAPHTQGEASVLELLDQLRLLEGRREM